MARKVFLVCTQCETANQPDAKKCNGCGRGLSEDYPLQKPKYIVKWACDECGELNMKGNPTCVNGCNAKERSVQDNAMWFLRSKVSETKQNVKKKQTQAIIKGISWLFDKIEGKKK